MPLTILDDYFNPAFWCVASCCVGWVVSTIGTAVFAVLGMFIYMYIFLMAPVIFPVVTLVALLLIALILDYRDHLHEPIIGVNPVSNNGSAIPGQPNGQRITPSMVRESPRIALHPAAIARLPTFGYQKQETSESMECTICLTAFEEGEQVKQLPRCFHLYHPTCIDQWLRRNYTCPICRDSARKDATGELVIIVDN